MPLSLPEIFPDEDYRFHLTLRKGDLAAFFTGSDPTRLAERKRWMQDNRERYVFGTERATPLLNDFETFLREETISVATNDPHAAMVDRLQSLGKQIEPDVVLLSRDSAGSVLVAGGVVCFPSSWTPAEKLGQSLENVHGVVPGLNPALGAPISQFLRRLRPGTAYERSNWGLAATPELNMHPALNRPRLSAPLDFAQVWVRIEDQILGAVGPSGTIVFGIKLRVLPLSRVCEDPVVRSGLARALATMPESFVAYKGLASVREELLQALLGGDRA